MRGKKDAISGEIMNCVANVANSYLAFQTVYQLQAIEAQQLRDFNVSFKIQFSFQESIVDILQFNRRAR